MQALVILRRCLSRAPASWRRVMVWVHGGGMMSGDSSMDYSRLVATQRVVLVNVNYRLGPLGFLSSPELEAENGGRGNGGMNGQHDVIVALQWVYVPRAAIA